MSLPAGYRTASSAPMASFQPSWLGSCGSWTPRKARSIWRHEACLHVRVPPESSCRQPMLSKLPWGLCCREEEQQRGITMKSSAISLLHSKEDRKGRMRQQQAEGQGATPLPTPPPTDPSQPPPPPTAAQEATPPPADPTQPPAPPTAAQEAAQPGQKAH